MVEAYNKGRGDRRKLSKDYRIKVTNKLNYHINDNEAFKGRHTNGQEGALTRNRLLPLSHLIVSKLGMGKSGLQREMDRFLKETENEQFTIRRITKSGFSRTSQKLAPEAFQELNDIIWKDFYEEVDFYGYHGQKLLAADGTYLNLPNHPSIREEFDSQGMGPVCISNDLSDFNVRNR